MCASNASKFALAWLCVARLSRCRLVLVSSLFVVASLFTPRPHAETPRSAVSASGRGPAAMATSGKQHHYRDATIVCRQTPKCSGRRRAALQSLRDGALRA